MLDHPSDRRHTDTPILWTAARPAPQPGEAYAQVGRVVRDPRAETAADTPPVRSRPYPSPADRAPPLPGRHTGRRSRTRPRPPAVAVRAP
jgi:hypothetical protein